MKDDKSTNPEEKSVRLRVLCVRPPDPDEYGAEFGLQDVEERLQPGERQADGSFLFECQLRVRRNRQTGQPNFLGPYVFGIPGARFLYLSWRERQVAMPVWSRRMKIPLSPITWEQIEEAERTGGALEAAVPGRAGDGGLRSGSVAFLGEGWTVWVDGGTISVCRAPDHLNTKPACH